MPALALVGLVALGGALGAALRHLAVVLLGRWWGVAVVNVLGAAALGVLVGAEELPTWQLLGLGTGVCGALTTWSSLGQQTAELARTRPGRAAAYLVGVVVAGVLAALPGLL